MLRVNLYFLGVFLLSSHCVASSAQGELPCAGTRRSIFGPLCYLLLSAVRVVGLLGRKKTVTEWLCECMDACMGVCLDGWRKRHCTAYTDCLPCALAELDRHCLQPKKRERRFSKVLIPVLVKSPKTDTSALPPLLAEMGCVFTVPL